MALIVLNTLLLMMKVCIQSQYYYDEYNLDSITIFAENIHTILTYTLDNVRMN